jgi:hypothetical protein
MDQEKKPILMAQMGVEVCAAQQHNSLSLLAFCDQKNPKNTLLKVRNVVSIYLYFDVVAHGSA